MMRFASSATDRSIPEIKTRLLILLEGAVEAAACRVPRVGADDGKAARERGAISGRRRAQWVLHRAVQAATALHQKP
ncbi:MAG TPA: hypothetical protein VE967_06020, partial [Gemmatimonadaceae bacterium]|nr:hypothetical protein [Gemmatimonadaceae bacterium]